MKQDEASVHILGCQVRQTETTKWYMPVAD